jgi:hypothetical protein
MDFNGSKPDAQLTNWLASQDGGQESAGMTQFGAEILCRAPWHGDVDVPAKLNPDLVLDAFEDLQHGGPLILSK